MSEITSNHVTNLPSSKIDVVAGFFFSFGFAAVGVSPNMSSPGSSSNKFFVVFELFPLVDVIVGESPNKSSVSNGES